MDGTGAGAGSAAELVRGIREGDARAEGELVARYGRGVATVIRRSSRDAAAAEELYQQTFQIALEKIRRGDVREPEKLGGFLCSLARNVVIGHYRRAAERQPGAPLEDARAADPAPGPLEELLTTEKAAIVRRVLDELPTPRDREVLTRFYLAEDDKDAICRDLGLSSLHFNRVLFRARERFRELYEEAESSRQVGRDNPARSRTS